MSIQQAVFSVLTVIMPILGIILPGFFKQDRLSAHINGLIATAVVLVCSGLQAWSAGQINFADPWLDFGVVLTVTSTLLIGPFKPVDAFIQSNWGIGAKVPNPAPVTPAQNDLASMLNGLVSVFSQHTQILSTLIPVLQSLQSQPAQNATTSVVAPAVHGPASVASTATVQPSTDGVQAQIAPFTATSQQPAIPKPTA